MKKLAVLALAATMSVSAFAVKIGVVNTQEVFAKYSGTKKVQQELVKEKEKLENDIRSKEVELQKLGIELQGKGAKVTEAEKTSYNKQAQALDQFVKGAQKQLSQKEYQSFESIRTTIDASVQSIAKKNKYDYVLEAGAVKFGGTDITQDVIKMMESTKKIDL
ncbi:hypothetical protein PM10SUCC1_12630 [Propionigenium maris DSM 9537]|uniref:Periplasmic chaperone for outer membrane proteins Skp n=1 Tax=Propionigenium maris DSM 9537 TaxID=1123000 RepID=A0A9W6GID5_9FUSO|nr:OmpH family outer membrane protein [Propionigenium maris]GLI55749.1 hypothetical protein PM10SUCC1_12630 [Propionigenium maris DSM 9537]